MMHAPPNNVRCSSDLRQPIREENVNLNHLIFRHDKLVALANVELVELRGLWPSVEAVDEVVVDERVLDVVGAPVLGLTFLPHGPRGGGVAAANEEQKEQGHAEPGHE